MDGTCHGGRQVYPAHASVLGWAFVETDFPEQKLEEYKSGELLSRVEGS